MKKRMTVMKWVGVLALFCLPAAVSAQIVYPACIESGSCYTCDLVGLFVSISNFVLLTISGVVIAAIAYGGFMWIYAAGSTEKVQKGTQIMFGAVTGLIFVLCGWVMVNLAMAALLGQSPSNVELFGTDWSEVCKNGSTPTGLETVTNCTDQAEGTRCSGGSCTADLCMCNDSATCVNACTLTSTNLEGTSSDATCVADAAECQSLPAGRGSSDPELSCPGDTYCCVHAASN